MSEYRNEKIKKDILQIQGRRTGNRRLHCRLKEIMSERGYNGKRLHQLAHVGRDAISQLRNNNFKGISSKVIVRICDALQIEVGELFELLPEDIWLPIRLSKKVTFHFGSRLFDDTPPQVADSDDRKIYRPHIGLADFRAFMQIQAHLTRLEPNVRVNFEEHVTNPIRTANIDQGAVQRIFDSGNHVFLGSPIALAMVEEVVCRAYGVKPYNPEVREAFPYGFAWDARRRVRSSLGWQGHGNQCGIAALPSNKIVAPCTHVTCGVGTDGGLIVVYRSFTPPLFRDVGSDDERIIICLLGYSGSGTEAAAQIAIHSETAAGLYPGGRRQPRMRAVSCRYFREAASGISDRQITEAKLVPEPRAPRRKPPLRMVEGEPYR